MRFASTQSFAITIILATSALLTVACGGTGSSTTQTNSPAATAPPATSPGGTTGGSTPTTPASPTPTPAGAQPAFAYAGLSRASSDGRDVLGYIAEYQVDANTGALVSLSSSPAPTPGPDQNRLGAIVMHPSGKFIYSVDQPSGPNIPFTISALAVNSQNGQLTAVSGSPYSAGLNSAGALAIDSTGKYLFVPEGQALAVYSIDANSGALTAVAGSPFATSKPIVAAATDSAGNYVFALAIDVGSQNESVLAFHVDRGSGGLSAVSGSPFSTGGTLTGSHIAVGCECLSLDRGGKYLYAANSGSNTVTAFAIDSASGKLTTVAGSPFATGTEPLAITAAINTDNLFVGNYSSDNVQAFSVNTSTGALTSAGLFPTGHGPHWVSIDPSGNFLYVPNAASNDVSVYKIQSAGSLAPVAGSPFLTDTQKDSPMSFVVTKK